MAIFPLFLRWEDMGIDMGKRPSIKKTIRTSLNLIFICISHISYHLRIVFNVSMLTILVLL